MAVARRSFLGGGLALAMLGKATVAGAVGAGPGGAPMYGMIGKMKAKPGQRSALAAILGAGTGIMPGCLAYIVAEDLSDGEALWITEIWDSKASHDASLALPAVKDAIRGGRPLIAGFELGAELRPLSGVAR
jgi:quinol monooxygenase YgiN